MNINEILNKKLPFFFSFFVSLFLVFSNAVFLEKTINGGNVLGANTKSKNEKIKKSVNNSGKKNLNNKKDVKEHVSRVKNTTLEIKRVAKMEREVGNVEVSDEIIKSADNISFSSVDNISSLEKIENRPAWKSFLLGPDYKNLGKIRSNLVQTRNQIRKIEKTLESNVDSENNSALRSRLRELEQERLRIHNYIDEKDDDFSLFGWLAKLISGYNKSIEGEEDLSETVEIVDEVEEGQESSEDEVSEESSEN